MKIFFSATTHNFDKYGDDYFNIREHLVEKGHVLVHDWLINIKHTKDGFIIPKVIPQVEYKKSIRSIEECDIAVFESTQPSFSTGHLLTIATQNKTPTLVLWKDDSPWAKNKGMIESIESEYLELAEYNDEDLMSVIDTFLNKYVNSQLKHRFNLVIDEIERQYLDWLSYKTFKSRTKLLRSFIREQIAKDSDYKRYLQDDKRSI